MFNHVVSQFGAVTGNVTQSPNGLFGHNGVGRSEQGNETADCTGSDDGFRLF